MFFWQCQSFWDRKCLDLWQFDHDNNSNNNSNEDDNNYNDDNSHNDDDNYSDNDNVYGAMDANCDFKMAWLTAQKG